MLGETNEKPRDIAPLVDFIKSNGFKFDEPIVLSTEGVEDGKRRLAALVEAGVTAKVHFKKTHTVQSYLDFHSRSFMAIWERNPQINIQYVIHAVCMRFYCQMLHAKQQEDNAIASFDGGSFLPVISDDFIYELTAPTDETNSKDLIQLLRDGYFSALANKGFSLDHSPDQLQEIDYLTGLLESYDSYSDLFAGADSDLGIIMAMICRQDLTHVSHRKFALQFIDFLLAQKGAGGRETGAYSTPPFIAEFMVSLAQPRAHESIYDPCFGTGGLLVEAAEHIRRTEGLRASARLEGIEINPLNHLVAKCRFALMGMDDRELHHGDAITGSHLTEEERGREKKCDLILAVPPMGAASEGSVKIGKARITDLEQLFLYHTLKNLKPGGRAVICLRRGFSYRSGTAKQLRKLLLDNYSVRLISELPKGAFQPHSNIECDIFLIQNKEPGGQIQFHSLPENIFGLSRKNQIHEFNKGRGFDYASKAELLEIEDPGQFEDVSFIKERDYDLRARSALQFELQGNLHLLQQDAREASIPLPLTTLGELADIMPGVPSDKNNRYDEGAMDDLAIEGQESVAKIQAKERQQVQGAPLIRISDIKTSAKLPGIEEINPSVYLNAHATESLCDRKLRSNDVLLSVSGTIGKLASLRHVNLNDFKHGLFVSSGLAVIRMRPGPVEVDYIKAILKSEIYQSLVNSLSRGSGVKRVDIGQLNDIPVPLPPYHIQIAVAEGLAKHPSIDPFVYLSDLIEGKHYDESDFQKVDTPKKIASFQDGIASLKKIYDSWLETQKPLSLSEEMRHLSIAIETYQNGDDRLHTYHLLDIAFKQFNQSLEGRSGHLNRKHGARIKDVTSQIEQTISALFPDSWDMELKLFEEKNDPEGNSSLEIISNWSELPLRRVFFSDAQGNDWGYADYLSPGQCVRFTGDFDEAPNWPTKIYWEAEHWNGKEISGEQVVKVEHRMDEVEDVKTEEVTPMDWPDNPWNPGQLIASKDRLFGRQREISKIISFFGDESVSRNLLIYGNRRAGKSSIIKTIQAEGMLSNQMACYADLHKWANKTDYGFWDFLAQRIWTDLHIFHGVSVDLTRWNKVFENENDWDGLLTEKNPFQNFQVFLSAALDAIAPRCLLLIIDEYTLIEASVRKEQISSTTKQNIRSLFQELEKLSFICAGVTQLKGQSQKTVSELFGFGEDMAIGPIPYESARRLIEEPSAKVLSFESSAVDEICALTDCNPYLIQNLCFNIFLEAKLGFIKPTITEEDVMKIAREKSAQGFIKGNVWEDTAGKDTNRYVLCTISALETNTGPGSGAEGPPSDEDIRNIIKEDGVISEEDLDQSLEELFDCYLIDRTKVNDSFTYNLKVGWLHLYIEDHVDINRVKTKAASEATTGT